MGYERLCEFCAKTLPKHYRYDKRTCNQNCRKNLSNAIKRNQDWQLKLTPKADKTLDNLLRIGQKSNGDFAGIFNKVMRLGNLYGHKPANGYLETIADILDIFTIN